MHPNTFSKFVSPGVYQIKETGGLVIASVDRLLADGSKLSDPENGHLLGTIDAVIQAEYPAAPTTLGQQGASIALQVSNFGILAQWMRIRGLHYFDHLTQRDLNAFIYDSACGLDAVLQSQARLLGYLDKWRLLENGTPPEFPRILEQIGIPATQAQKLPAAKKIYEHFVATGNISEPQILPPNQISTSVLWARAKTIQLLWVHREALPDPVSFQPSVSEIAKRVKRFGRPIGQTRELPIDYTCQLVGLAFTWVYQYGPHLTDLLHVSKRATEISSKRSVAFSQALAEFNDEAESQGWDLRLHASRKAPTPNHISWFVAASTFLPVACFTLCGIFTARRITELVSLRSQDLKGTIETGFWYSSYLGKRAKNEEFPCTRSVADAIRLLAELKIICSIEENEPAFEAIRGTGRLRQRLSNGLVKFGRLVRAGFPEGIAEWNLAPHQFRKIFALIYRWRFDHPTLIALSIYFGHVSLKHIQAYTSSKEWKRDNQEAGKQFTLEKLQDIALGKVAPKGIFGKSLERAISRVLAQLELYDESEQRVALTQLIADRQIDLRANLYGYCGARSVHSNLRRAACSTPDIIRSKATIDPEASTEDKCARCLFFTTNSSRRTHWMTKSENLQRSSAAAPEGSMAKKVMLNRLDIIERFTRNNFSDERK